MSLSPDSSGYNIEATPKTRANNPSFALENRRGEMPTTSQIVAKRPAELGDPPYKLRKTMGISYKGSVALSPGRQIQRRMKRKALKSKLRISTTAETPNDARPRTFDQEDDMDVEEQGGYWTPGTISEWSGGIPSQERFKFASGDQNIEPTCEENVSKPHDSLDVVSRAESPEHVQQFELPTHSRPRSAYIQTPCGRKYEYITVYQGHQNLATLREMGTGRWIYKKCVDRTRPLAFYWRGSRLVGIYDRETAGWLFEDIRFLAENMKGSIGMVNVDRVAQRQDGFHSKVTGGMNIPRWPGQRQV